MHVTDKTKLKNSYLIPVSVCLIVIVLIIGIGNYQWNFMSELISKEDDARYSEVVVQASNNVENAVSRNIDILRTCALSFDKFSDATDDENSSALERYIKSGQFADIKLIKPDGTVISPVDDSSSKVSDISYFKRALKGETVVEGSTARRGIGGEVVYSTPVYDAGGEEIIGVLAAFSNEKALSEIILTGTSFDGKVTAYIMDGNANIVAKAGLMADNTSGEMSALLADSEFVKKIANAAVYAEKHEVESVAMGKYNLVVDRSTLNVSDWVMLATINKSDLSSYSQTLTKTSMFSSVGFILASIIFVIFAFTYYIRSEKTIVSYMDKCEKLTNIDPVTGHYTMEKFMNLSREKFDVNPGKKYAVISVDINKFRAVNDFLGHETGSMILQRFAEIIGRSKTVEDIFTRAAADTFYILLHYSNEEYITDMICRVISETEYQITQFKLTLSFGVYYVHDKSMDIRAMIDRADLARRAVKSNNESSFSFFDTNMLLKIREEKIIEDAMESALECDEFKVYLQPKFDLHVSTLVTGAEALVRWQKGNELVLPGKFIPLFERNGFIRKLDKYIFEKVCKQQKMWLNKGLDIRIISVNMSRANLDDPGFVQSLAETCQRYNIAAKYFEIEITESVAFENIDVLVRVFNELRHFGFGISIDDFGTGYSSLNMLKDLRADVLKIDRAFLEGANDHNDRASAIISHVVSLALALKMKTICEGIETFDQAKLLNSLGCDMAQGFYFARPMPIPEFERRVFGTSFVS